MATDDQAVYKYERPCRARRVAQPFWARSCLRTNREHGVESFSLLSSPHGATVRTMSVVTDCAHGRYFHQLQEDGPRVRAADC
jgi:hypothetical protein